MNRLISLLYELASATFTIGVSVHKLARVVYRVIERQNELEKRMATVDQEMRDRLDQASSRVAARLDTLIEKVSQLQADQDGAVDAALLADAQADADALRPSVEYLERLGGSDSEISPEVDPVPADSAGVENAPVVEGPAPVAPSEGVLTNDDEEVVADDNTATEEENTNNN